jgi:glutaredoxin
MASGDPIVVYSGVRCPDCELVKRYLTQNGLEFTEKNIHKDRASRQELIAMGFKSIPVTLVGEEAVQGFDREKLSVALGLA